MLPAKNRLNILKAREGMKPVFRGRFFAVKKRSSDMPYVRVGVSIGKRYSKLATRRNAMKREVFRVFEERVKRPGTLEKGSDIIVSVLTTDMEFIDNKEVIRKELNDLINV
jgi:ribonuclease P protein component